LRTWFINTVNGEQGATPEKEGWYTATLLGRDIGNAEAVVKTWHMHIILRPAFTLSFERMRLPHKADAMAIAAPIIQLQCAGVIPGETVSVPDNSTGGPGATTHRLQEQRYGALHTDAIARAASPWGVGEAIRLAPITLINVSEGDVPIDASLCTFTLEVEPKSQDGG
jgi:hypothetical protein